MILRSFFLAAIFLLFPAFALAAHLDLAWDPNSEPDLAGYIVYYGTSPGDYTDWIDVGNVTSVRIKGLRGNMEYFVAVTAYDRAANESDFSAEVSGLPAPGDDPPSGGGIPVVSGSSSGGGCFITRSY